jgi:hypothetical protein
LADSAGRLPLIYLDTGFYRHRLTTKSGTLVFDDDGLPVVDTVEGGTGTSVDPDSVFKTRDVKIRFDDQPLQGYVRLNGRTIGSASSGATERANADTQSLFEELWSFANVSVVGGKGASAAADFAANKQLTLPDARGRGLFGTDDMGAGASGRISTGNLGSNPAIVGASGGLQSQIITVSNLPSYVLNSGSISVSVSGTTSAENTNHTHAFSGTTSSESVAHTHEYTSPSLTIVNVSAGGVPIGSTSAAAASTGGESSLHNHTFSGNTGGVSANHTHSVTATGFSTSIAVNSGGSGAEYVKLPPLMTLMIFIRL